MNDHEEVETVVRAQPPSPRPTREAVAATVRGQRESGPVFCGQQVNRPLMPFPIRVSDVMSHPVRTAYPETTAAEAAEQCTTEGIGSLVVVEEVAPVGIVTSSDLVRLLGSAGDPASRPVEGFMSSPVETIEPSATVTDAIDRMSDAGLNRLVVVENGAAVGLVSVDDVSRCVPQVVHRRELDVPGVEHTFRARQETAYERPDWEFECACVSDESVSVGDRVTFTKTVTDHDVRAFAAASGDTNRLHLDDQYAAETRFGRPIVHGTLVGGLISAALARIPGVTIYLSQDLSFLGPVDIGDRVTATCTVAQSLGPGKFELTTDVFGPDGDRVIEGESTVLVDDPPAAGTVSYETMAPGN